MRTIEIMGEDLDLAFKELNVDANKTYQSTDGFQVWEINYNYLDHLENSEWKENYGWWRYGYCTLEGSETTAYMVNDKIMYGWLPSQSADEDIKFFTENKYASYTDWLSEVFELGTDVNKVIFAKSLARENNMSLKEFISIYQK